MKKAIITLMVGLTLTGFGQQDIMVSQYMFNGLFLNPAYAGSHDYVTSSLLHRNQWVNFPGAPKTLLLAVDGELPNKKMGIGGIITNDRIGATEQTDLYLNYSYQVKLGEGKLAFGIKGGASNYIFKSSQLLVWDENDNVFAGRQVTWLPKVGTGAYYYAKMWYAGISIPTLLAYDPARSFDIDIQKGSFVRRHYFINAGYVFVLNDMFKLKPSMLIKYQKSAPLQGNLNLNLLYNDMFWIGASWRSGDAVSFILEYQTNSRFRVGYAFDYTTSKLRNYTIGSHEIMIGFDFGRNLLKVKTPRYF